MELLLLNHLHPLASPPGLPCPIFTQQDAREIQNNINLLPLASINPRDDVTRTEIWIIGARPSLPRFAQGSSRQNSQYSFITVPAPCCR